MDCVLCGRVIEKEAFGWDKGHNAYPINEGRCCAACNDTKVLPARLAEWMRRKPNMQEKES